MPTVSGQSNGVSKGGRSFKAHQIQFPEKGIYVGFLNQAFDFVRARPSLWIQASFWTLLLWFGPTTAHLIFKNPWLTTWPWSPPIENLPPSVKLLSNIQDYFISCFFSSVATCFTVGMGKMAILQYRKQEVTIGVLFSPLERFGAIYLVNFFTGIVAGLGLCFFVLPGLYLSGRLFFAPFFIGIDNCGFGEAISKSWKVSADYVFGILLIAAMSWFASVLGAVLFGVGLLMTMPVFGIVMGLTYATFREDGPRPKNSGYPDRSKRRRASEIPNEEPEL